MGFRVTIRGGARRRPVEEGPSIVAVWSGSRGARGERAFHSTITTLEWTGKLAIIYVDYVSVVNQVEECL